MLHFGIGLLTANCGGAAQRLESSFPAIPQPVAESSSLEAAHEAASFPSDPKACGCEERGEGNIAAPGVVADSEEIVRKQSEEESITAHRFAGQAEHYISRRRYNDAVVFARAAFEIGEEYAGGPYSDWTSTRWWWLAIEGYATCLSGQVSDGVQKMKLALDNAKVAFGAYSARVVDIELRLAFGEEQRGSKERALHWYSTAHQDSPDDYTRRLVVNHIESFCDKGYSPACRLAAQYRLPPRPDPDQ